MPEFFSPLCEARSARVLSHALHYIGPWVKTVRKGA